MNRRGFLLGAGGILASFAAPAIVRADSLMRILPRETLVLAEDRMLDDIITWDAAGHEGDFGVIELFTRRPDGTLEMIRNWISIPEALKPGDRLEIARVPEGSAILSAQLQATMELYNRRPSLFVVGGYDATWPKQGDVITVKLP